MSFSPRLSHRLIWHSSFTVIEIWSYLGCGACNGDSKRDSEYSICAKLC